MSHFSSRRALPSRIPTSQQFFRSSVALAAVVGSAVAAAPAGAMPDEPPPFDNGELPTVSVQAWDVSSLAPADAAPPLRFTVSRRGDTSAPTSVTYKTESVVGDDASFVPESGTLTFDAEHPERTVVVPITGAVAAGGDDHAVRLVLDNPDNDSIIEERTTIGVVANDVIAEGTLDAAAACQNGTGAPEPFNPWMGADQVDAVKCETPAAGSAHDVQFEVVGKDLLGQGIFAIATRPGGAVAAASSTRARLSSTTSVDPEGTQSTSVDFAAGQTRKVVRLSVSPQGLLYDATVAVDVASADMGFGTFVEQGSFDVRLPEWQSISGGIEGTFRTGGEIRLDGREGLDLQNTVMVWQRCAASDETGATCVTIDRVLSPFASTATRTLTAEDAGHRMRAVILNRASPFGDQVQMTSAQYTSVVRAALKAPTLSPAVVSAEDGTATFAVTSAPDEDGLYYRYREQGSEEWSYSDTAEIRVYGVEAGPRTYEVQSASDGSYSPSTTVSFVMPGGTPDGGGSGDGPTDGGTGTGGGGAPVVPVVPVVPTSPVVPTPPVAPKPPVEVAIKKKTTVTAKSALKKGTKVAVTLKGTHKFTGTAVISSSLAKKLGLKSRTVASFKGTGSGRVNPRLVFTAAAAKALAKHRSAITLTLTVKIDDGTKTTGTIVLKRG